MPRRQPLSPATVHVLQALAGGSRYGFDVIDVTGLPSGTVYPILARLEDDGLVGSTWEEAAAAHQEGRPARRYYRVTGAGAVALEEALAHYRRVLAGGRVPAPGRGR